MKLSINSKLTALLAVSALAMTGCQDEDFGYEAKEIAYYKSFAALFGKIDPKQNFNMAAQYQELCEKRSATSAMTRAGGWTAPEGWTVSKGDLQIITTKEVTEATSAFPEGSFSPSNYAAANSYYISDGKPLYIRPIWGQTNSSNRLGVYSVADPEKRLEIVDLGSYWSNDVSYNGRNYGYVYTVNIPKGEKYGFYLERTDGHTHFSEAALNEANNASYGTCESCNITLAHGGAYVGFEDWGHPKGTGTDYDCNDIVLHVSPSLIDKLVKLDSWIVACEDLGNIHDIDFNDVVLDVAQNGTNLTITPLAAGGTIPSVVYFKEGEKDAVELGEIHSLLGSSDYTQPINATSDYPSAGDSHVFTVSEGYDLNEGLKRGDIYVVTNQETYKGDNDASSEILTTATIAGQAPKVIIVPSSWEWPYEITEITTAYTDFVKWVSDETADIWLTNKTPETYVKRMRKSDGGTSIDEGSGDNHPSADPKYDTEKGLEVDLEDCTNGRFIQPSYFAPAIEYADIYVDGFGNYDLYIIAGNNEGGQDVNSEASPFRITGEALERAKIYGYEVRAFNYNNWSNVTMYVKTDNDGPAIDESSFASPNLMVVNPTTPVALTIGNTPSQITTISDNKTSAITYKSSDSSVATVSAEGVITPVSQGTATITISQRTDGTKYKSAIATVEVTVSRAASRFSVTTSSMTLNVGGGQQIEMANKADGSVSYTEYDSNVIEISGDGYVRAKKAGSTTIKIKQAQSDQYLESSEFEVSVTIEKGNTELTVPSTVSVETGMTSTFEVESLSDGNVVVSSDNSNITVSVSGKIITVDASSAEIGATATISVEQEESSDYNSVETKQVSVIVTKVKNVLELNAAISGEKYSSTKNGTNTTVTLDLSDYKLSSYETGYVEVSLINGTANWGGEATIGTGNRHWSTEDKFYVILNASQMKQLFDVGILTFTVYGNGSAPDISTICIKFGSL